MVSVPKAYPYPSKNLLKELDKILKPRQAALKKALVYMKSFTDPTDG